MAESKEKFPEVQGGGSLILAWQIKNKPVLVVGGGEVSLDFGLDFLPQFLSVCQLPDMRIAMPY